MLRSSHDACGCSTQTTSTINLKRSTLHPHEGQADRPNTPSDSVNLGSNPGPPAIHLPDMTMYFQFPRSPELSRYFRASILQSRATEWQKRSDAGFAHGPGAWDPRKDFSQCMQQSIIL